MNPVITTGAAVLTLAVLLALTHVPLGTWIHRVFTDEQDWRVERAVYRLVGVDPRTEQRWTGYAVSVVVVRGGLGRRALPADRGAGLAAVVAGPVDGLAHRAQHGRLVHDEHQLAVVCR